MLISIVLNATTGRFHPFVWYPAPLPSTEDTDTVIRYKSRSHHTEGFPTLAEAQAAVPALAAQVSRLYGGAAVQDGYGTDAWEAGEVPARHTYAARLAS